MTGGLGFVKAGQNSLENNRRLLKKEKSLKHPTNSILKHNTLTFKKASKAELDDFKANLKLETKKDNRRNTIIFFSMLIIVIAAVLLLVL